MFCWKLCKNCDCWAHIRVSMWKLRPPTLGTLPRTASTLPIWVTSVNMLQRQLCAMLTEDCTKSLHTQHFSQSFEFHVDIQYPGSGYITFWCTFLNSVSSIVYRVSHNWVFTLFWLFSRLPVLVQRFIWPFFNSRGDDDFKTHLTFLPI